MPLGGWGPDEVALGRLQSEDIGMVERACSINSGLHRAELANRCVTMARTLTSWASVLSALGQEV